MRKDILLFLASFNDGEFHELQTFLKRNFGDSLKLIKSALAYLKEKGLIEMQFGSSLLGMDETDPASWHIMARITEEGREELHNEEAARPKKAAPVTEIKKSWWETEAARKQFLDHAHLKKQTRLAIYLAMASIALTITLELLRVFHIF